MATVLRTSPRRFVSTEAIDRLTTRTLRYLNSGYSVHLRGPAGTGKTTLALHLADLLQRPMMLMFGDDEAKTSDLIGKQSGYTRKKIVDNYIHSVVKVEDHMRQTWVDSRLTLACREGYTLIYDEFNRSRPEVNNVLLSVLEEKILVLPPESNRVEYLKVSPQFRAIFTSNPEEYCGVHATQDALMDRLITIDVPVPDDLTQQEILLQKTELDRASVITIIQVVNAFRVHTQSSATSGLRSCLMISKICKDHNIIVNVYNAEFRDLCADILLSRSSQSIEESVELLWQVLQDDVPSWANSTTDPVQTVLQELIPVTIAPILVPTLDQTLDQTAALEEESIELTQQIEALELEMLEHEGFEPATTEVDDATALLELAPEETAAKLDENAWKAVLETARPVEDSKLEDSKLKEESALLDLLGNTVVDRSLLKYVDLSPEIPSEIDSEIDSEMGLDTALDTAIATDEMLIAIDALPNTLPDASILETDVQDWDALAASVEGLLEPPSIEDQLFRYLLACEKGARLSEIEVDLQLHRSQAVDAIRDLAKSNRLAQRDRHFFALK